VRSLPDKVLDQVALVLGQQKVLGLLHHLLDILDKGLAFGRQLGGGVGERARVEEAVQGDIDLVVLRMR
jgi:hypothetical protein